MVEHVEFQARTSPYVAAPYHSLNLPTHTLLYDNYSTPRPMTFKKHVESLRGLIHDKIHSVWSN